MAIVTETPVEGGGTGATSYDTSITTGGADSKIVVISITDANTTISHALDPTGSNDAPDDNIVTTTYLTDSGFSVRMDSWDGVGSGSQTVRTTLGATEDCWVFLFSMTGAATGAAEDSDTGETASSISADVALDADLTITDNSYQVAATWSGSGITVSSVSTGMSLVTLTSTNKRCAHSTPASQSAGSQATTFTWDTAFGGKGVVGASFAEAAADVALVPGTASLTLTGQTPEVGLTASLTPGTATLTLTGQTPSISYTQSALLEPGTAALTLTGEAPVIEVVSGPGDTTILEPGTAALTLTGQTPTVSAGTSVVPGTAALTITGRTPSISVGEGVAITAGTAALTLTGQSPTVGLSASLVPGTAALTFTGHAPSIATDASVRLTAGTAALAFTGQTPVIGLSASLAPGTAALALTGQTPTINYTGAITPAVLDALGRSGRINYLGRN